MYRRSFRFRDVYIFATYVYDVGVKGNGSGTISYVAAVGMFESVVCAIMLLTSNYIARKRSGTSIW